MRVIIDSEIIFLFEPLVFVVGISYNQSIVISFRNITQTIHKTEYL